MINADNNMRTEAQIEISIFAREEAVYATLEGDVAFTNSFTGKGNSKSGVAVYTNEEGIDFFGFLPDESTPYMPIGGRSVLAELVGEFVWMPYNFSDVVTIKKGKKL
jgi:hypothetical protein